jgi:hypothetical protein
VAPLVFSWPGLSLFVSVSGAVSLFLPCLNFTHSLRVPLCLRFVCTCVCIRKTYTHAYTHQNLNAHAIMHALVTHAYKHIFLVSRWQVTRWSSLACGLAQCMVLDIWCHRRAPSKHLTCSKSSWTKNPGEDVVTHACCGVSCLERRVKRVRCVRSLTPTPTCHVCEREGGRERGEEGEGDGGGEREIEREKESIGLTYLLDRLAL